TSKLLSPSAATVRLTPSTATDPWGISSGSSSRPGNATRTRVVDSTRVTSSTVPTPSTCPRTRWPPRAPPNRSEERRVGKECKSRGGTTHSKETDQYNHSSHVHRGQRQLC